MRRRRFLALAVGLPVLLSRSAGTQAARLYRIGFLSPVNFAPGSASANLADGMIHRLEQLGYVRGTNLEVETRGADRNLERLPGLVEELAAQRVDVIVANSYPAAAAAKQRTGTIGIVVINAGDPVKTGLVASLKQPGGNVTGISDVAAELAPKRLELLKETVPGLKRVAMLWNANDLGMTMRYEASAAVAKELGVVVQPLGVREPSDFEDAFAAMSRDVPDGLLMVSDTLTFLNRKRVYDFAAARRLPAIYEDERYARDSGLMSYGPDPVETVERAASLVDRLLKGANPAELPLEQPTRFHLVVNLKTAKALGITVPQSILARADEVIE
jgi:putative ABC transport system substrate-binding protein